MTDFNLKFIKSFNDIRVELEYAEKTDMPTTFKKVLINLNLGLPRN